MKKIILSLLLAGFSSVDFIASDGGGAGGTDDTVVMIPCYFVGRGSHGERRALGGPVRFDLSIYETVGDFVDYLRTAVASNGFPYVEGDNVIVRKNLNRSTLPLFTRIADINFDGPRDCLIVEYIYEQLHEEAPQPPSKEN